uniref:Uncharacterized protein n=1 Tax=Glossina brevipalpis TaxID=37001 RepID=A0A1A9WID2_9MUSC
MNRSQTFVNSLKWWPTQSHNNNQTNTNGSASAGDGGGGGGVVGSGGHGFKGFITFHKTQTTFGSSVAVQKLRESKWFKRDEQRIFCAVVECGFIVEVRNIAAVAKKLAQQQQRRQRLQSLTNKRCHQQKNNSCSSNSSSSNCGEDEPDNFLRHGQGLLADNNSDLDDEDELELQNENETPITSWFGIVLCKTAKDNKPKPETIEIFSVKIRENGTFRMLKMSLDDIWNNGWELRINNFADKEKPPHNEKDIRNQISFARKAKHSLWNNNKHFVYWCRYGSRQQDVRKRQMSECVKWGSVGMNAGIILLMNKQKSYSTSK